MGLPMGFCGGGVPELGGAVAAPGQDGLAVAAERHGKNVSIVREKWSDGLCRGGVPELGGMVRCSRSGRSCRRG